MIPLRLYAYGALLALVVAAGLYVRHVFNDRAALQARLEVAEESMRLVKRAAVASERALTARLADRTRIVTVTKEIIREVPTLIPAGTPALPGGFRVLHDAAALGVPTAASGADGSPVPAQDAAETVVDNYGTCADTASQLARLQEWVRAVGARGDVDRSGPRESLGAAR